MEKSNLRIDEEQKKVFFKGKVIGRIYKIEIKTYHFEIYFEYLYLLSNLNLSQLFYQGFYFITIDVSKRYLNGSSIIDRLSFIFQKNTNGILNLFIDLREFDDNFTESNFYKMLKRRLRNNKRIHLAKKKMGLFGIRSVELVFRILNTEKDIKSLCDLIITDINTIISPFYVKIDEVVSLDQSNLSNTFTFPPEIQSSCEQYLIYFATFLKDIGINAETNIESKAHKTLFTVTPKDGEEALDKIREALSMYLSLPQNPEFDAVVAEFPDMGVQQLASQVYFLKSQLVMANATLQMKDATIKSLQLTNYQQKTIIDSQQTKEKNEEEIAGGLAKVKEVDLKIISFNLPELLRRIKRKFQ